MNCFRLAVLVIVLFLLSLEQREALCNKQAKARAAQPLH